MDTGSGLLENYCRNPDEGETIWCYTTDVNTKWDLCDPLDDTQNKKKYVNSLIDCQKKLMR